MFSFIFFLVGYLPNKIFAQLELFQRMFDLFWLSWQNNSKSRKSEMFLSNLRGWREDQVACGPSHTAVWILVCLPWPRYWWGKKAGWAPARCQPPSTTWLIPVIIRASSEARNATDLATSSAVTEVPIGWKFRAPSSWTWKWLEQSFLGFCQVVFVVPLLTLRTVKLWVTSCLPITWCTCEHLVVWFPKVISSRWEHWKESQ